MATTIIITICVLILIAYVFDVTFARTRIPSVILLLLTGWFIQQLTISFGVRVPDLSSILPVLGTIGLILIVLEGGIDLELNRSKLAVIRRSIFMAVIPMLAMTTALVWVFTLFGHSIHISIINALPLCVISSAIAIPSAKRLSVDHKEFVTYESSMSDIVGLILFNLFVTSDSIGVDMIATLIIQIVVMSVIAFIATGLLSFLLSKLEHSVKFTPIIALVILIYSLSKLYHLPALLFILIFGLFIGNLINFREWITFTHPEALERESHKFGEVVMEATFLVKVFFFILFGYYIQIEQVVNIESLVLALGIVIVIYSLRALYLKLSKMPITPLLYFAPRGLITILLFLMIPAEFSIPEVNRSLITQVIILTAIGMIVGTVKAQKAERNE